jgi:hypothetical protein
VVGVVTVLFDFFSALLFGDLSLLALPPEEQTSEDQKRNDDDRNNDGNGGLSTSAEATRVVGASVGSAVGQASSC